ncbi:MAG: type III pantothenate kinase [Clostridia bacterium]|nr:type III pantothenate kinase [Clostridia bacterium]
MLLAIDIGNTNLHVGLFEEDDLRAEFCISATPPRSADEYGWLLSSLMARHGASEKEIRGVIIGSVVPSLTQRVRAAVKELTSAPILTVGPGVKTGFPIRIDDPAQLGADLAATTAATLAAVGAPAVVVDFGSATVLSVIDKDGAYAGGSFLPGIGMSLEALRSAELLPEVSPEHTVQPLGRNTEDCMRAGVLRGQALSVCGFFDLYKKAKDLPEQTPLVVTGGYAEYLLPYLPHRAKHIPHLTLLGLLQIYRLNEKRRS